MAKIDELLQELCPDGVEYVSLDSILEYEQPSKYIVKSTEYNDLYSIPVLTAGKSFLLGYTDETSGVYEASSAKPTIIFDDFTTSFHWVDFPCKVKSSALKFIRPKNKDNVSFRYVYYQMSNIKFVAQEHIRHWISVYSKFEIPLPPFPIQQEIVEVLDTFTDAISNLEKELALREKQFEFYREQLFNFDEGEFEWKYIPELASYSTGLTYKPANVKDTGTLVLRSSNIKNNQLSFEDNVYVQMNIPERSKVQLHDILICVRNGSKNLVGKCAYISNLSSECAFGAFMNILRPYNINSKFLYYSWQLHSTINQYKGDDASPICQITNKDFARIRIKVPSEVRQQEIVEILDTFESMIANIKEEIVLRTKQYEYYREKLLSFGK